MTIISCWWLSILCIVFCQHGH